MVNLFDTCRKLLLGTTIYDSGLCSETKRCAGSVHCYVASADHDHLLSGMDRGVIVIAICLHQVVSCEEFVCREYTIEMLSRDVHEARKTCSRAYKHC